MIEAVSYVLEHGYLVGAEQAFKSFVEVETDLNEFYASGTKDVMKFDIVQLTRNRKRILVIRIIFKTCISRRSDLEYRIKIFRDVPDATLTEFLGEHHPKDIRYGAVSGLEGAAGDDVLVTIVLY